MKDLKILKNGLITILKTLEEWVNFDECDIDFTQHKPIHEDSSLHVIEEQYEIDGNKYRLFYPMEIEGFDNKPKIQILKKDG